ncbi:hypothetical protein ONS96_000880 [Cadophora gregata f. sp. sojae]|nr:hypothetical protein ONS96_000880 [Cadophora gregata f. sp. sojae]
MPNWKSYESSVRLLSAIIAAHPGLKLNYDEIVSCYGSTTTNVALQTHFARDITPNVKLIQDIRAQGGDAKDVVLIEGVRHGNPGKAIAGQYGDGVSENGGSAAKKTPNKRTPGGGKRKKAVDGDDDESMAETPSKKAKSARGAVKTPSKRSAKSYTEHDSEVDDEDVNGRVKPEKVEDYGDEDISAPDYSNAPTYATNGNGNGYGYGRGYGHSNGHAVSQDHYTFEDNDNFNSQDNHYGDEDEEV